MTAYRTIRAITKSLSGAAHDFFDQISYTVRSVRTHFMMENKDSIAIIGN
jgi:hypothetical protein